MSKSLTIAIDKKLFQTNNGPLQVLGNCHFEIKAGELFVLLGESGCGKTTLIRLILGLDRDFKGTISSGGKPITGPGTDRCIVFQEPRLLPWMSVAQNVKFALANNLDHDEARNRVLSMLELVGLKGFEDRWPRELSGGMAQRAALARALVNVPEILMLDEPFGALDLHTRIRMQDELLSILSETGTTTLLITHDIDEALYLGDRIGVMASHPGRLVSIHSVELPRPRKRNDEALLHLRSVLFEELLSNR